MFGGAMIGMLITPIRVQLGPIANGLVIDLIKISVFKRMEKVVVIHVGKYRLFLRKKTG